MDTTELPVVYVSLRINRRLGVLPLLAQNTVQVLKGLVFAAACAALIWWTLSGHNEATMPLRISVIGGLLWMIWDRVLSRTRYGYTHIFVTTKGVMFGSYDLYLDWDHIESYQISDSKLKVAPHPEHRPKRWPAPKTLDIPVTKKNREILSELFRENVELPA